MDSSRSHPRRRFLYDAPSTSIITAQPNNGTIPVPPLNQQLRKSATFHSPTSPSSRDEDPILNIPTLPRRSPTCRKDLEDAMAAGDNRLTHLLGAVDRSLSGLESFSCRDQSTSLAEDLPVPRFLLNPLVGDADRMDVDHASELSHATTPQPYRKHHTSDSGIGSTISSSESSMLGDHAGMKQALLRHDSSKTVPSLDECRSQTGINGVAAPTAATTTANQHALSEDACRQIHKYIILPITREEKLKDFHPLVNGIPYRVARKEITCLRDLEKVLLWLAPKWSVSKASFLNFCETSIQCIHTTVEHLNDHDQRRPTDRPYTNGYFLDLVEQVQQYAAMLVANRSEKVSKDDNKITEETLSLVGGLSQTGRPAELVRIKDGQSVSLRTGEIVSVSSKPSDVSHLKRALAEESDDDVMRSMARRRKSAQPVVKEVLKCRECARIFKRPCDLTKHEKTHSRPWKCHDSTCKYHDLGWPTEKERDRHVNDKHSAEPPKYRCQFSPCPYESKRESNCKQHMEKAHGWTYIRSKNNGKIPRKITSGKTPPTPQMLTPGSCMFEAQTPDFRENTIVFDSKFASPPSGSNNGSMVPSEGSAPYTDGNAIDFNETFGPFNPELSWPGSTNEFSTSGLSEYNSSPHRPSWSAVSSNNLSAIPTPFEPSPIAAQELQSNFLTNFDWSNMDNDYQSMNVQLFTPAASVDNQPYNDFSRNPSVSFEQVQKADVQSFSPGAQGDAMLYSPFSNQAHEFGVDETYGEFTSNIQKSAQDFTLYSDSNVPSVTDSLINESMFQDLNDLNNMPSTWSGRGSDLAQQFNLPDLMDHE